MTEILNRIVEDHNVNKMSVEGPTVGGLVDNYPRVRSLSGGVVNSVRV